MGIQLGARLGMSKAAMVEGGSAPNLEEAQVGGWKEGFRDARVLITGGLGSIGSNLARWLVDLGAHVTLVDSLIPEYGGNLFNIAGIEDRVWINLSDVRDEHSMSYLIQGQHYLFNLAGQTSHLDSMRNPYTDLETNCRALLRNMIVNERSTAIRCLHTWNLLPELGW